MCTSPDENFIFSTVNGGLVAIDAASLTVVDMLNFDAAENVLPKASRIQCCQIKPSTWIVALSTTSGSKYFLFCSKKNLAF